MPLLLIKWFIFNFVLILPLQSKKNLALTAERDLFLPQSQKWLINSNLFHRWAFYNSTRFHTFFVWSFKCCRVKKTPHSYSKGTTINDLGGGLRKLKKKNWEALLQEKINFERHSQEKNKFWAALHRKKEILRGLAKEKSIIRKGFPGKNKFISKKFPPPPPSSLMVVP